MNELALFSGCGGGLLAGALLGFSTVCAVEVEPYAASVLCARQNDGFLAPFPVWDDVRTFDGRAWRGTVDIVSGGFPCQDISPAGKGAGITGKRSGLWKQMHRIIGEVRPSFVFVENSPFLRRRGLETVLADLSGLGYDAAWCVLGAADVGAPHVRKRLWLLARARRQDVADPDLLRRQESRRGGAAPAQDGTAECGLWWRAEPDVVRVVDGLAFRVDRVVALGNGQVPVVAAVAFAHLYEQLTGERWQVNR